MNSQKYAQIIESMNKTALVLISIVITLILGVVDYVTGIEFSFSIFYLIPISFSSWYLGKKVSIIISVISALIWFCADFFGGHLYSSNLNLIWNSLMRLTLFLIIANLISYFKEGIIKNHNKELEYQKNKIVIETFQKLTIMIVDNIIVQNAEVIKWLNEQKENEKIATDVLERSSRVIGESMKILSEVSFVSPYISDAETDVDMYLEILKKRLSKVNKDTTNGRDDNSGVILEFK